MRRGLLAAALLVMACVPEPQPGLDLDFGGVCKDLQLAYVDPPVLLPGWTIHAMVADGVGAGGWALVSQDPGAGLHLLRLADEAAVPLSIGADVSDADDFSLIRGPLAGESWLVLSNDTYFYLWRLDPGGLVAGVNHSDFPSTDASAWERRLIFIQRQAYMLASPRASADESVIFPIARLTPDLAVDRAWQLAFGDLCDPDQGCIPYAYPRLHVLDIAEADGVSSALLLLEFDRESSIGATRTAGVAAIDFDLNPVSDLPTAVKREFGDLYWLHSGFAVHIEPGQITRDDAGYYILAGIVFDEDPPLDDPSVVTDTLRDKLLRHDIRSATSQSIATLLKSTRSHILQLPNQSALGQTPSGSWYAARLKGYDIDDENVVELKIDKDATLERIGHGQVHLRAPTGDARARLGCVDE